MKTLQYADRLYKGFYFPDEMKDKDCKFSLKRVRSLEYILEYWPKRRRKCAVQAGGSYGVWPNMLADEFNLVYTFEPDWVSFYYLSLNCPFENVFKMQCALSDHNKTLKLKRNSFTSHQISDIGYIPGITLDSLKLLACDVLLLDIEGYELPALKGAKWTIREFNPLILLEWREENFEYYQIKGDDIQKFLDTEEYEFIIEIDKDRIYKHKGTIWNPPI